MAPAEGPWQAGFTQSAPGLFGIVRVFTVYGTVLCGVVLPSAVLASVCLYVSLLLLLWLLNKSASLPFALGNPYNPRCQKTSGGVGWSRTSDATL